jgi:DNA gyrase inhibitor GyrI
MTVPEGTAAGEGVEIKTVAGGLYAVARCHGIPDIFNAWQSLLAWREDSQYKPANHQWLEECVNPAVVVSSAGEFGTDPEAYTRMIMDLYMPIAE